MPDIRVRIVLQYALRLSDGDYQTSLDGDPINVAAHPEDEIHPQTMVSAIFGAEDGLNADQIQQRRVSFADRLLRRTNRLLRWYRAVRRKPDIGELTRAQASPFRFEVVGGGGAPEWQEPLQYEEAGLVAAGLTVAELTNQVRDGVASGNDPDVDVLFLLDAERAVQQGRFREAVLFCWSTIDSVFNRKYNGLVDVALAGENVDTRRFFKGFDFHLRSKMSGGMHLIANRSLYREPDNLWDELSASYDKRNAIIHSGENATEDDARLAIRVARRVVAIMNAIHGPTYPPNPAPAPAPAAAAAGPGPAPGG